MLELLVATTNKGKLREIRALLKDLPFKITSLIDYPNLPEIIEDGKTFKANAIKKALTIAQHTHKLTLGEDSGIEVKALNNAPGVYSARFAGVNADQKKNNAKLMRQLKGVPLGKRQARYRCFAALADEDGVIGVVDGQCGGLIALKARGKNGFGYDPYFIVKPYNKTFGELPAETKSKISHRSRALKKVRKYLLRFLQHSQ